MQEEFSTGDISALAGSFDIWGKRFSVSTFYWFMIMQNCPKLSGVSVTWNRSRWSFIEVMGEVWCDNDEACLFI